jgi:hypothetical protein
MNPCRKCGLTPQLIHKMPGANYTHTKSTEVYYVRCPNGCRTILPWPNSDDAIAVWDYANPKKETDNAK